MSQESIEFKQLAEEGLLFSDRRESRLLRLEEPLLMAVHQFGKLVIDPSPEETFYAERMVVINGHQVILPQVERSYFTRNPDYQVDPSPWVFPFRERASLRFLMTAQRNYVLEGITLSRLDYGENILARVRIDDYPTQGLSKIDYFRSEVGHLFMDYNDRGLLIFFAFLPERFYKGSGEDNALMLEIDPADLQLAQDTDVDLSNYFSKYLQHQKQILSGDRSLADLDKELYHENREGYHYTVTNRPTYLDIHTSSAEYESLVRVPQQLNTRTLLNRLVEMETIIDPIGSPTTLDEKWLKSNPHEQLGVLTKVF